jgi:perosamine synthetase
MSIRRYSRRQFVKYNSLAGAGAVLVNGMVPVIFSGGAKDPSKPAILGGKPVRKEKWPDWPFWDPAEDEKLLLRAIRSGVWSRAGMVAEFENKWAETVGAKRCLATVNGTGALIAALGPA